MTWAFGSPSLRSGHQVRGTVQEHAAGRWGRSHPDALPSTNCNAFAERFVLSIKSECLDRMIFFGEPSLRQALREYLEHYNRERAHQGIGNRVIDARPPGRGAIRCHERLGGLLKHYQRAA